MFCLGNSKELYTRSGRDANSEKWSQQFLSDSQDWSSQFFTPQDIQRQPAAPSDRISSFMQSSSQGSTRGGPGTAGRTASQAGISKGDVYLAREIRFGLHTILSVMRELPDRLKDINEVLRASQQSEETNCLIKETSEKLEGLVVGLEKKLTDLLENKENSDVLQRETNEKLTNIILGLETRVVEALQNNDIKDTLQKSLSENNDQLKKDIAEIVKDLTSQSKENEHSMLEEHRNITKKEVHKELKKFRELHSDLKSHLENSLDERMASINEDVAKLYGKVYDHKKALQSVTTEIKSVINEKQSDLEKHLEESLKEVISLLNSIVNKVTVLPQKIHVEVCQAVNDAVQNLHIPGGVSGIQNVSPSDRMMTQHRPVMPFSQRFLRSQVSPIAQVHPQIFRSNTPSVAKKSDSEIENGFITPISNSQKRLSNLRPISQVAARVDVFNDFPKEIVKQNHPVRMQETSGNILQISLLNSGTQQFSPESVSVKVLSDSEESLLLHCDSGSSSGSEDYTTDIGNSKEAEAGAVKNCSMRSDNMNSCSKAVSDSGVMSIDSKIPSQVSTPNVRKAPFIIANENSLSENKDEYSGGTFAQPLNPAPAKKAKLEERTFEFPTVIISPSVRKSFGGSPMNSNPVMARSRRFLTPLSSQGLRFKMSCTRKKF